MGNSWENSTLEKDEVVSTIDKINGFAKKIAIIEFIGLYLEFSLDENSFSKKIIKVDVQNYNSKLQRPEKEKRTVRLTISEFMNYYNALINALSNFYESRLKKKYTILNEYERERFGSEDANLCPICDENKIDISLPCSHFFCEGCLKSWMKKSKTCPLCRLKLEFSNKAETPAGIKGSGSWSIITRDENLNQEIKKDSIDIFLKLTNDLFYNQKSS